MTLCSTSEFRRLHSIRSNHGSESGFTTSQCFLLFEANDTDLTESHENFLVRQ